MKVVISIQSEHHGDLRVQREEDEERNAKDAFDQLSELLEEALKQIKGGYNFPVF